MLLWIRSLRCVLLFKRSIYTLQSNQWITIWWAKFELERLQYYSFTSDQNWRYLAKTHTEEGQSKISYNTVTIYSCSHQKTLTSLGALKLISNLRQCFPLKKNNYRLNNNTNIPDLSLLYCLINSIYYCICKTLCFVCCLFSHFPLNDCKHHNRTLPKSFKMRSPSSSIIYSN